MKVWLSLLLLTVITAGLARAADEDRASATLYLNRGGLAQWRVEIARLDGGDARLARKHPDDYAVWRADESAASARAATTTLRFEAHLEFVRGDRRVRLDGLRIAPVEGQLAYVITDARGRGLWLAEMAHRMPPVAGRVEWRNLDLRVLPDLARRLGVDALAGQAVGALDLRLPSAREAPNPVLARHAKGTHSCRSTLLWPDATRKPDLSLIDISAVFAMRCNGCAIGSSDGTVVFAPNAELGNTGPVDIPWLPKFSAPSPPYGNDQHPFLVWNLYRLDAQGRLAQIGVSGLKHAFFAVNNDCDCTGDVILYRGCTDLYSAFTNDSSDDLGPRGEIIPWSGRWGRCGSIYDQDCDGNFDPGSGVGGPYNERLTANEIDLLPTLNAGASWWFEAWYLVREDSRFDNSIGTRAVLPVKTDAAWTLQMLEPLQSGAAIDRWAPRSGLGWWSRGTRVGTPEGGFQVGARVTPLPDGRYRYDYALMNIDYMRVSTTGGEPNLRITSSRGLTSFQVSLAATASASDFEFADVDKDPGNDWTVQALGDTRQWQGSNTASLTWGRMHRFTLISDAGPTWGAASVGRDAESVDANVSFNTLVPGAPGFLFADGFE